MAYPRLLDGKLVETLNRYAELKHEYGARGVERVLRRMNNALASGIKEMKALRNDAGRALREPNGLAAISAAFAVNDPVEALEIGLSEIPRDCATAKAVRWALSEGPRIRNYRQARAAVDRKFPGMHSVHTINNACLTVFGIMIGKGDVAKTIGETVAMGLDNDCTAATAGSIAGAIAGRRGVTRRWYRPFGNTIRSYLTSHPEFEIDDVLLRFAAQAARVFRTGRLTTRVK